MPEEKDKTLEEFEELFVEEEGEEDVEDTKKGVKSEEKKEDEASKEENTKSTSEEDDAEEEVEEEKEEKEEDEESDKDKKDEEEKEDEIDEDPKKLLQRYKSLQGMWKSEKTKREEIENKLKELEEKLQNPPSKEKAGEEDSNKKRELTKEEEKWVESLLESNNKFQEVKEDFPEIAEAFEEALTQTITEYSSRQAQQVMEMIQQNITPLLAAQQEKVAKDHFEKIKEAHPDYEDYVDNGELESWIEAQSSTKKKIYKAIYEEGSAEEVIDLFDVFKEDIGIKKKKTQNKKNTKKLDDMDEPTTRHRSISTTASKVDINDFEAAFEEALKEKT